MKRLFDALWPPLVVLALVLAAWQGAVAGWDIKEYLLPSPSKVIESTRTWQSPNGGNALVEAIVQTGKAALAGFFASLVLGTLMALAFATSRVLRRGVYPYTIFFQTVPVVAIAPLIVLWSGSGFRSVALVAFILSVFPVVSNATQGLTRVDAKLLELFESYGATRWQLLFKLRLPGAVPYLVAGARVASGLAVIGAIVGEFFVGYGTQHHGLGYQITVTADQLQTDLLFAAIGGSTALGLALFGAVGLVGRLVLARWSPDHADR